MSGPLGQNTVGQKDLELAKWLAVIAMAIDHYGKIVEPDLLLQTHTIGRISFPLFASIIGVRLGLQPMLATKYVRRLLPWAVISQPVFVFVGRDWHEGNIMLTLLLGVLATSLFRKYQQDRSLKYLAVILALSPITWLSEFGILGAATIPITAYLASRRLRASLFASGPLGVAANLRFDWPPLGLADTAALLASVIAIVSVTASIRMPLLPTHLFYGFYPAHLIALHLIDVARNV